MPPTKCGAIVRREAARGASGAPEAAAVHGMTADGANEDGDGGEEWWSVFCDITF